MLTIHSSSGVLPLNVDDYYIKQLASGYDELCFQISIYDPAYPLIQEEATVREQSDAIDSAYYLVKAIDAGKETANVKCQIDVDDWKASLTVGYKSASLSVGGIVRAVAPTGWAVSDQSGLTYLRTIELTSATPLDVLEQCRSTFSGVTFRFDNINKLLTIANMTTGQNLGAFATRELNLKENNYKGKSTGFATRLYAYGKDGLSFADINSGKPYVDDNTYSSRVICAYWKDERYTVKANLLADAREKLAAMAVPQRSFECDIVDLAATDPEKYGELDFPLFSRCILIDQTRSGTQVTHIVAERWIYPHLPQKNKIVLSTVAPRIQSQVSQIINSINNPDSAIYQQISSEQESAIENATAQITGAKGGNMRSIYDSNGNWTELVVMNTASIDTASKLWRFNLGGFGFSPYGYNGPYTTAITMDGAIVADFITTGTLSANVIAANSINVSKLTGSIKGRGYPQDSQSWEIDLENGSMTVGNIGASHITAGTISADRIAANSIGVGKLTGSITGKGYTTDTNSWEINLTNGTMTIGNINASNIKTGTLDASNITVSNLNASSITAGTLSVDRIDAGSITGAKIGTGTITGGANSLGEATGNIAVGTITGGTNAFGVATGNLGLSSVSYGNTSFTTTLDQVSTNASDIASINSLFSGTLVCNNLTINHAFQIGAYNISTRQASDGYTYLYVTNV